MNIEEANLFMMCEELNEDALSEIPEGYTVRPCRRNELDFWKRIHFDRPEDAEAYSGYMTGYFDRVYAPEGNAFFEKCLFICDADDRPVGTCFAWKVYGCATTIHWYKVLKNCEDRGLGRALLSCVMRSLKEEDYPVFLHTQPASYRAIKLYNDFGFALLTDKKVGYRENYLEQAREYLMEKMPEEVYKKLKYAQAPEWFLQAALTIEEAQF